MGGKGKKGGKGQKNPDPEVPSLSKLSLSDNPPTTSQDSQVSVEPEDVGLGLTGTSRKKSKGKQQAVNPVPGSSSQDTPAIPEVKTPAVAEPTAQETVEEGDGLGLRLTGARKRNPRKKKKDSADAPPAVQPQQVPVVESAPPVAPPSSSDSGPPAVAPTSGWGRGRGRGGESSLQQRPIPQVGQPQVAGDGIKPAPQSVPQTAPQPVPQSVPQTAPQPVPQTVPQSVPQQVSQPAPHAPTSQPDIKRTEMPLCRYAIPAKIPGNTVKVTPVNVLTNYLRMTIKPLKVHRYDVSFKPDKPKKFIPLAFKMVKDAHFKMDLMAFDQMKNCYCLNPLKVVTANERFTTSVSVKDPNGRAISFEVSFKATGVVDLGRIMQYMQTGGTSLSPPTEAIQAIDVILRQGTLESYVKAGRMFFRRPSRPIDLGDGLEMWTGLFQSAIFTSLAFVNIDVVHKGFPKQQRLIDAIARDFRLDLNRPLDEQRNNYRGVEYFKMFIKNLRVNTLIKTQEGKMQRREFICNELVNIPSRQFFTVSDPNGREIRMSVADYYTNVKNYRIQYPNLNCMWVGPRDKSIYYPMELLDVSYGQALNKQLNESQLAKMVREAATPPDERKRKIEDVISDMNYSQNGYFKKFGLEIEDKFFPVVAKVLHPPHLDVGDRQLAVPRNGTWNARRLLKPEPLQSWAFIAIEPEANSLDFQRMINLIMETGTQMGMKVEQPKLSPTSVEMNNLLNILTVALKREVKFLFIVVSTRGRDYYHRVKKMAERDVGILTQCIKENTASRRMNGQTVRNILLKVNSKLMGINQALDRGSMPKCLVGGGVMIVGADVTHPSPEQTSVPSIAAVTASIDPKCFSYNIELSIQTPKKEMIVQFEDMMVDHLKVYKEKQGTLPKKIYVFRDGVSEGQFAQVMNSELAAVHSAYHRMTGTKVKPEVLFLLVQKRHHTRLFDAQNSRNNVEPGTVVDTHIVHARELDFYLVSHQAIKGTARPTRYHAVCNDGRIPADEVEQLTYYLCHLYSRCMRAVSYPTPTYYAHLACLRARSLTFGEKFNNADLERNPQRLHVLKKMLDQSRMFFV